MEVTAHESDRTETVGAAWRASGRVVRVIGVLAAVASEGSSGDGPGLVTLFIGPGIFAAIITAVAGYVSTRRLKRLEGTIAQELADAQHRHAAALEDHRAQLTRRLRSEEHELTQRLKREEHELTQRLKREEHELAKALEAHKVRLDVQRQQAELRFMVRRQLSEAVNRAYLMVYEDGGPLQMEPQELGRVLREADDVVMAPLRDNEQLLRPETYAAVLAVHNLLAQGRRPDGRAPSPQAVRLLQGLKFHFYGRVQAAKDALRREGEPDAIA